MKNTTGNIAIENMDIMGNVIFVPPKYNKMWGADYMLMDGKAFLGGIGGEEYKQVIDMFVNVWNAYNYRVFAGFEVR